MTVQHWLPFLHLIGTVVWFGAGITLSLIGMSVSRTTERIVVAVWDMVFKPFR